MEKILFNRLTVMLIFVLLFFAGLAVFLFVLARDPGRAWQTYLINFVLWSSMAQGALAFSMVNHISKARWSGPLQGLAESFSAFFPVSFIMFLLLFLGREHIFPWLHMDIHGKAAYLNIPFLFSRDILGLLILYGSGFFYLFYALRLKIGDKSAQGLIRRFLQRRWAGQGGDLDRIRGRASAAAVVYLVTYAVVLSMMAVDLIMSLDPHWLSTLFGAYSFVKAFYLGLGGLIILAGVVSLAHGPESGLQPSHFHNLGKLFLAFCLLWADFFYAQFLVIWYGNIPEETSYIIKRTSVQPWQSLAWVVFSCAFIIPFLILLNRRVKTVLPVMLPLCVFVFAAFWLEHLLLVGPALGRGGAGLPLDIWDGLISLGFLGLLLFSVTYFLRLFPELVLFGRR